MRNHRIWGCPILRPTHQPIFPQLCPLIRGPLRDQESSQKGQQHVKEPVEYLHDCSAPVKDKVDARKYLRKLEWIGSHAMV